MASIPSNFEINIAQADPKHRQFGTNKPLYRHHAKLELGQMLEANALLKLADTRTRYPAPDFNVTMTHWVCRGYSVGGDSL